MRFARLGEEAFLRRKELNCEEFFLYSLIVFHTWTETGICKETIAKICEIHDLEYHNTVRRYKFLRMDFTQAEFDLLPEKAQKRLLMMVTPWVEKTKKGIRPIVGMKSVNFTPAKSVKFTPKDNGKSVNFTPDECKIYTSNGEKSVNFTPAYIGSIEPLKTETFIEQQAAETNAAATKKNDGLSKFSEEECLRYAEISKSKGEPINSVHALAKYSYDTGKMDAAIQVTLYPETPELTYEIDENEKLRDALLLLREVRADGEDWQDYKKWYTPEDWQWLMNELE